MRTYSGRTVCGGSVEGAVAVRRRTEAAFPAPAGIEEEKRRFQRAKSAAMEQLLKLEAQVESLGGAEAAAIFSVHRLLLEDYDYVQMVMEAIDGGKSAQEAATAAGRACAALFEQMEDPYLRERGADMMDISARVRACLEGGVYPPEAGPEAVLLAEDFYPSEMAAWQRGPDRAMVSSAGSEYPHASILARALGAPALVQTGVPVAELAGGRWNGKVEAGEGWIGVDEVGDVM